MEIESKSFTESHKGILLLPTILYFLSMDFMHLSNYLMLLFVALCLLVTNSNTIIYLKAEFFMLFFSFLSYFCIYHINNAITLYNLVVYLFGPIAMYICGQLLINSNTNENNLIAYIYTIAAGLFTHGVLNIILFLRTGVDILTLDGRSIQNIWGGYCSATLQNTNFVMTIALLFFGLFISKSFLERITIFLCCLFSVYASIVTASRTILYLAIIVPCIVTVFFYFINRKEISKLTRLTVVISITIIICLLIYSSNIFNVQDWFNSTSLAQRTENGINNAVLRNSRWKYSAMVWNSILDYPFGNNPIKHFAHNMWLDAARLTGIIPFFFLVLYSILTIKTLIQFILCKQIGLKIKYIAFSIYVACTILFFIEPILEGIPYFFSLFCFINSMISKLLYNKTVSVRY